jgi:hypothetical protein
MRMRGRVTCATGHVALRAYMSTEAAVIFLANLAVAEPAFGDPQPLFRRRANGPEIGFSAAKTCVIHKFEHDYLSLLM